MSEGGHKDDTGKYRYDLIPAYPLERLAEVYTIGAGKYAARNWEKGLTWGRVFAAMMRHAWAWWRGETHDPVDGQHHLSSVAWCAFALMEYEHKKTGEDDRPFKQPEYGKIPFQNPLKDALDKYEKPEYGKISFQNPLKDALDKYEKPVDLAFSHCEDCHSHVCTHLGRCTKLGEING